MKLIKLRWYQEKGTKVVLDYWRKHPNKNPVIAVPTGGGKSLMIADLIHEAVSKWGIKVLVLSHRKEILSQNKEALQKYLKQMGTKISVGIYSAGLKSRVIKQVTIAGIQSIYNKSHLLKDVKMVIIDEAHLIPPTDKNKTMYNTLLSKLNAKCVGYTATPYRLGTGYIVGDQHIFDEIPFDLTSKDNFNRLVNEGYLSKLICKGTDTKLDATGVKLIGGEYSEKELADKFDVDQITKDAVKEIVDAGKGYKKWLIFAINIKHAEHIVNELNNHSIVAMPVHSKMTYDRSPIIKAYKEGKIQCLVNVNILTTGIDVPDIDLIALLRPIRSPSLYVQSVGRGLRTFEGKDHCLILDFAMVVGTLGPINDVKVSVKKRSKDDNSDPVMKQCPDCRTLVPPAVRECPTCGFKFEFNHNIRSNAVGGVIVSDTNDNWYNVDSVFYTMHDNGKSPRSMKITYQCGLESFSQWCCLEHVGYAKRFANNLIKFRSNGYEFDDEMNNVEEMLKIADKVLSKPKKILIKKDGKYPEVVDYKL